MKMTILCITIIVVSLIALSGPTKLLALTRTDTINVTLTVTRPGGGGGGGGGGGCPPDCPPPPATTTPIQIINVTSNIDATSVIINWDTNLLSTGILEWGETTNYELGSTTVSSVTVSHSQLIDGLVIGTTYYFRITAISSVNPTNSASFVGSFVTVDRIPPANATNFIAVYNPRTGFIDLSWNNPTDPDFQAVRIMRSRTFYPTSETDGELVYDGSSENTVDSRVTADTTYYYTLFTRDGNNNYSSGVIARARVPGVEEPPPDEFPPPEVVDNPFAGFPTATSTDPLVQALDLFYFKITQGDRVYRFTGGSVDIDGSKPFTVSIDYDKLPEILKTVAVTIKKPGDPSKAFSFLLKVNQEKTEYAATVGPLGTSGTYPLFITIVDYQNQGIKRLNGALEVLGAAIIKTTPVVRSIVKQITPIGTFLGIAAAVTELANLALNIRSLYDVYLLFMRFIGFILGLLGLRRKSTPWGTVYDSVTKRPLDPAYVSVTSKGSEVADAITDLDGRYGFLLPGGSYTLAANKTHYQFPSKKLSGKKSDELYSNLYFGEEISTKEGEIINKNIPMDPVGFDWNEFVKNKKGLFKVFSRQEKIKKFIFNSMYVIGFISTTIAYAVTPNLFNAIIFAIYVIVYAMQLFWKYRHKAISVIDNESSDPIPFAIVRLFLPGSNQEVKAVVADEFGRFYSLVSPGKYFLTVEIKQESGDYAKVYQSPVLNLSKGILNENIEVDTNISPSIVRSFI